jgi:hypothetical protein
MDQKTKRTAGVQQAHGNANHCTTKTMHNSKYIKTRENRVWTTLVNNESDPYRVSVARNEESQKQRALYHSSF